MARRRPYRGSIACEWCGHEVGGSSKSGVFSNYTSHVLARHAETPTSVKVRCGCKACKVPAR